MITGYKKKKRRAFTLIELLIVIGIIAILATILVTAVRPGIKAARAIQDMNNLKQIAQATLTFAAENDNKLPSPQYPGGHSSQPSQVPEHSDFAGTGSGLWIDGVVYYTIYGSLVSDPDSKGSHLRDTVFVSKQSFNQTSDGNAETANWYEHSFAMNQDIQHDHLYNGVSSSSLTNKTLANISDTSNCLLFIENSRSNVIGIGDRTDIIDTGLARWGEASQQVHAAFLDGSARKLKPDEIPADDTSIEGSKFWKGVGP